MKFVKMGHAALLVSDLKRSIEFYRDVLGFEDRWTKDEDWANLGLGPDDLSLVRRAGARHPPHLGLRVASEADLEAFHAKLQTTSVKVQKIAEHRDGSKSFYFTDPDNNILEALWDPNVKL